MEVKPDSQNVEQLFNKTVFYIDFYQRQYKWERDPVIKLLDDIFYKFNNEYKRYETSDIDIEKQILDYGWYYLNTVVTNNVDGNTYLVDGQQRLTTLSLILIKLYRMSKDFDDELSDWIGSCICGHSGKKSNFWMNHEGCQDVLKTLYDTGSANISENARITERNIVQNYKFVSDYIDANISKDNIKRYEAFVYYFLRRVVVIRLDVSQTDVPMVFEVINDRGVKLKPYEILKGKLLGQVNKKELDELKLNESWDNQVEKINNYATDEIDQFFIYYLKSKFADVQSGGKQFDNNYHRAIMDLSQLGLNHNEVKVKSFLKNEFNYYTNLYLRLLKYRMEQIAGYESVYYNSLNKMNQQVLLILSACKLNDPEETLKIQTVSKEMDRFFCLLTLQQAYESNSFGRIIYEISSKIRNGSIDSIRPAFDEALISLLKEAKGESNIQSVWNYNYFRNAGYSSCSRQFLRYVLARLDLFLCNNTKTTMRYDFKKMASSGKAFHVEHILSDNENNRNLFLDADGTPDGALFSQERNRLGGLLILKGPDNQSSNNEPYQDKLKTYSGTLLWNESLRDDLYKSNKDLSSWISANKINMHSMSSFGREELEERHKLLFDLFSKIWA